MADDAIRRRDALAGKQTPPNVAAAGLPFAVPMESDLATVYGRAVQSMFALFEDMCEGALAVDRNARIVWINEKYRALLGISQNEEVVGREVEDVIPHSMMRRVAETGHPTLLDIMRFRDRWFVVTRLPVFDDTGVCDGAIGFVLYDRVDYLKPIVDKFTKLREELAAARRQLADQRRAKYSFSQFIGSSQAVMDVKRLARRAAQLDTTVLLAGETGTGKEMLSHAIHESSERAKRPFVGINVAAIPDTLVEAELFGAAPGAYTGADRKGRDGKFKIADGGTLLLDEVGDMPLQVQTKLLRVLQEREFEPLGSNKLIKTDVRIIAATSRDLKQLVDEGKFRSDLYFRLNVLAITIPPLRTRLSDLEGLCEALLEQIAIRTGGGPRDIDRSGLEALLAHDWPGNIRELANALERACMETDRPVLTAIDFARILPLRSPVIPDLGAPALDGQSLPDAVSSAERNAICAALKSAGGKKAKAARILGISRSKLYQRLEALGMSAERT
jgi:transcriptional regulator with PAS, ATPase and Fis domain